MVAGETSRLGLCHADKYLLGRTAIYGCHCLVDMVVCMCKVLATPRSWYVCLTAEIVVFFKQNLGVDRLIFLIHLHTHAMGELFCDSQPTATTYEKRNCSPTPFYSQSKKGAFNT